MLVIGGDFSCVEAEIREAVGNGVDGLRDWRRHRRGYTHIRVALGTAATQETDNQYDDDSDDASDDDADESACREDRGGSLARK